ncbi:MAG: TIGR02206 family membrane protein [Paenibacillaceae bacterium]
MERYFRFDEQLLPFIFYSMSHWVSLMVIASICVLLFLLRKSIRHKKKADLYRYGLAGLLLLMDVLLNVWYRTSGHWDISYTLPLHLCSLTVLLCIIMLLSKSYALFEFNYFAGIGGALQALLTPAAILSGFPHFTYYYFFIAHGGIIVSCLFMVWVYGYRPYFHSIGKTMIYLNLLMIPIAIVNHLTEGNYLFIMHKPSDPSLIDVLGPWPWYILSMEAAAAVAFVLLYVPFLFQKKKDT